MGTLFGKWQLLLLRYPYLTRIIFGILWSKRNLKKNHEARPCLTIGCWFLLGFLLFLLLWTYHKKLDKNNSLCVCMCGYMFVLCPLLFFSRKGRMQVLLNSTCKMDQADSTVCMSFLSSNRTEENSPNADALRTKDQDQ